MSGKNKNSKSLVFEFMQFSELKKMSVEERIKTIIDIVKSNKIILLEGRFKKQEEAQLIQTTMEYIDNKFKGIEIAVINPSKEEGSFFSRLKSNIANLILGEREGFTLIGPATIIRDIKQDSKKLNQLSIRLG
ncbi:MAG: OapB/ArvB family protein [Nanobdellota archaeon]